MSFIHIYYYKARILYCMIEIVISIWGFSLRSNLPMNDKNQESKYISQWWVGSILSPYFWYIYVLNKKLPNSDFELIAKACFKMTLLGLNLLYCECMCVCVCVCVCIHTLPQWLSSKESACSARAAGEVGSIPGSGRSPGRGKWQPSPLFLPGKSMGRGAWQVTVHRVAKSWVHLKRLSS